MRKMVKLLAVVAVVAAAVAFFNLNSSHEIICGNIEALTGGDNGASSPDAWIITKGRKATKQECEDATKPLFGIILDHGFTESSYGIHNIVGDDYYDCNTYYYGYVIYDGDYGKCVAWSYSNNPLWITCPQHGNY